MRDLLRYFIILGALLSVVVSPFAAMAERQDSNPVMAAKQGDQVAVICRDMEARHDVDTAVYTVIDQAPFVCPQGTATAGHELYVERVEGAQTPKPATQE